MASSSGSAPIAPSGTARTGSIAVWAVGAGALAAGLLIAAVFFTLRGTSPSGRATVLSVLPSTDAPEALAPAISPDGARVAFVARNSTGTPGLWLRALDSPSPRLLNGTNGAAYPFWSPDGRFVAFFAEGALKVIDPWDQSLRVVAAAANGRGGAWNRDGVIVFAPAPQAALLRVPAAGGETSAVTRLDAQRGELGHRSPVFLPDGQRFLYRAMTGTVDRILAGGLESGEPRIVSDTLAASVQFSRTGHLLFRRDGALMAQPFDARRLALGGDATAVITDLGEDDEELGPAFSVSDAGVLALARDVPQQGLLTWVDRSGARRGVLGDAAEYVTVAVSPDGTRVATDRRDPRSSRMEIWLIDGAQGTRSRFSGDGTDESDPIWSPDGAWIAFARGRRHVFRRLLGTGEEEALVTGDHRKYPTSWSSDGQTIFFFANDPATQGNVWSLPLTADPAPVLVVGGPAMEGEGVISPDGRWIAYDSDESGRYEVYVRALAQTDQARMVSDGGGWSPKWRRDGRELFYQAEDRPAIMAVPIDTGPELQPGTPVRLFETTEVVRGYDVTGDGQRFLLNLGTRPDRAAAALTIVMNWPALVGRAR